MLNSCIVRLLPIQCASKAGCFANVDINIVGHFEFVAHVEQIVNRVPSTTRNCHWHCGWQVLPVLGRRTDIQSDRNKCENVSQARWFHAEGYLCWLVDAKCVTELFKYRNLIYILYQRSEKEM